MANKFDPKQNAAVLDHTSQPAEILQAYRALERSYTLRTYQAQELMIEKLLCGHFPDEYSIQRKLHMFDLDLAHECFMIVIVRQASGNTSLSTAPDLQEGPQIGLVISSIFSELFRPHCICCPANLEDRYVFLLNFPEAVEDTMSATVASTCREAVRFIQDNFTFSPYVCVSAICKDFDTLRALFRETNNVLCDPNTVFTQNVCVRAESNTPHDHAANRPEPSIEKQYLNALVTQDFSAALELTIDRIRTMDVGSTSASLDGIKDFLHQRMQTTNNVLSMPLNTLSIDDTDLGEYCMNIGSCSSLPEIEKILHTVFDTLDSYFNTSASSYTGTTGKVVSLISKRYMEPDLSVEMICDSLGKSRSYLSRMFKENTGMNLLDYLHTTRLSAAKKLLNETNLGIAEIAEKVGYYSGWTLARVFKRYEGITPTAYRKAFCNTTEA